MRERITFYHPPGGSLDPDTDLQNEEAGLIGPQIDAVRQDRLTLSLDELPAELLQTLQGYDAVHLKWASPLQYETLDPFTSRISPGLHLSYSTAQGQPNNPSKLCSALQIFGPLECQTSEAFSEAKNNDASGQSSFYFHQGLEDLRSFAKAAADYCPETDPLCQSRVRSLLTSSSLDISFSVVTNTLQITAFWPFRSHNIAVPASKERRTEVGVLTADAQKSMEAHELGSAGILYELGEGKKPSVAIFTYPSRHRQGDSYFTSKFLTPTGLHPTMQLSLSSNQPPGQFDDCSPYAYLTLPKSIFADRYQLADDLFLASKNLTASRYTSLPVDLEAPAYTTKTWGSNVLLELAPPDPSHEETWTAEVPLHLRYLEPSKSGEVKVEIPYPAVFWACAGGENFANSPFDRVNVGMDALFDRDTTFFHVTPKPTTGGRLMNPVTVPVLKEDGAAWIGVGTTLVVGLGFAWVLWQLALVFMKPKRSPASTTGQQQKVGVKKE